MNAGREAALAAAAACVSVGTSVAVLVEGVSDQAAVLTVASRLGRDLDAEGVAVVPMGGATNIGHFALALGPEGLGLRLAGLYDEAEEEDFRRGLHRAGLEPGKDRPALERVGFFVCAADLEDELIRALGVVGVERVVESLGETGRLRAFRKQPAQRGRPLDRQFRRFIAGRSGAKVRYGQALVEAFDLADIPRPLTRLLAYLPSAALAAERLEPALP